MVVASTLLPPDSWLPLYAHVLRDWLATGGPVSLAVTGSSMWPAIGDGARVALERCAPSAVRVADVVVYEDGPRLVCHRVLAGRGRARADGRLLVKGDGVALPATWIPASAVIGRVVGVAASEDFQRIDTVSGRVRALAAVARSWGALVTRAVGRASGRASRASAAA